MSTETWGLLPKSQDDNETIEEAVQRYINNHLADNTAHLDPGESLYEHVQSDVIDHLVESVVRDKLAKDAVVFETTEYDRGFFANLIQADKVTSGAGSVATAPRGTDFLLEEPDSHAAADIIMFPYSPSYQWSNDFEIAVNIKIKSVGYDIYSYGGFYQFSLQDVSTFGYGDSADNGIGIRLNGQSDESINMESWVRVENDAVYKNTDIAAVSKGALHNLTIKKEGNDIKFFLDGSLEDTITKSLSGNGYFDLWHGIDNRAESGDAGVGFEALVWQTSYSFLFS